MSVHPKALYAPHAPDIYREIVTHRDESYSTGITDFLRISGTSAGRWGLLSTQMERARTHFDHEVFAPTQACATSARETQRRREPLPGRWRQVLV